MAKLWTPKEHTILQKTHDEYILLGASWSAKAAEALPGRTAAACSTRYRYLKSFGLTDVISKQLSLTKFIEDVTVEPSVSSGPIEISVLNKSSTELCEQMYTCFVRACGMLGVPIETIQRDC